MYLRISKKAFVKNKIPPNLREARSFNMSVDRYKLYFLQIKQTANSHQPSHFTHPSYLKNFTNCGSSTDNTGIHNPSGSRVHQSCSGLPGSANL